MATMRQSPTIEQVRREYDRRALDGRGRTWPRCRGSLRHQLAALLLRRWSDQRVRRHLYRAQVRLDPPQWARECC